MGTTPPQINGHAGNLTGINTQDESVVQDPQSEPDGQLTTRNFYVDESAPPAKMLLSYRALHEEPTKDAMAQFAAADFFDRLKIMTKIRMLERETNVKTLPAVLILVPIIIAIYAYSSEIFEAYLSKVTLVTLVSLLAAACAFLLLKAIRVHIQKETCLNAWMRLFEDIHTRESKKEEEFIKAQPAAVGELIG